MRFTLYGLLQYDNSLFDDVLLPSGLDKELCINNIIDKSGDLYLYYQVPERAKSQITRWFSMHYIGFERMIQALLKEYNPIENTDRYEDELTNFDTSRSNKASGSDSARSGTDSINTHTEDNTTENEVSAFDSGDYEPHDKRTDDIEHKDVDRVDTESSTTYGRNDDMNGEDKTHRVLHTHGNIGVTSNVELIRQELSLRVYNIYDVIAEMFENDILVQIY